MGKLRLRDSTTFLFLIAPSFIVLFALTLIPLLQSGYNGMFQWNMAMPDAKRFVGFGNYIYMASDKYFWNALFNTVVQVGGTVILQLIIGMPLALLLSRSFVGIRALRTIYMLPMMLTPIVVGLTWRMLLNPELGVLNYYLSKIGIMAPDWLGNPHTAMLSIILTDVWLSTPFVTMILLAGIQSLPHEPYESAKLDGASYLQQFRYLTLPLLQPVILVAVLFRLMDAVKRFDTIYVMTGGGPGNKTETLNLFAYDQAFRFLNTGYAAALSNVMFLLIIVLSAYLLRKIQTQD